jgi:hypothetical protein
VRLGKKEKPVVATSDEGKPLQVGDMCLLDVPIYADYWPLLGEVLAINEGDNNVDIRWWKASMSGVCKPEVVYPTRKRNAAVDSIGTVSRNQIWLFGFSLTKGDRLPIEVRRRIDRYDD